jgi:serine O-acetyltransferase
MSERSPTGTLQLATPQETALPAEKAQRAAGADDSPTWDLAAIVAGLRAQRERWRHQQQRDPDHGGRELPSRDALGEIATALCGVLFPMRLGPSDLRQDTEDYYIGHTLDTALNALLVQVRLELHYASRHGSLLHNDIEQHAIAIVHTFASQLASIRAVLDTDVEAAFRGDPAARSVDEVLVCYPGILATIHYRLAHELYVQGVPLIARIIAELAHSQTGIDIHPGAEIGEGFFIDHGTGVVIGETAVIGNRVRIYQAVTLGAKRFATNEDGSLQKGLPRHPVVEDDVVIYAGATILGRIRIGRGSSIGGNVWLTHSVPAGSNITQATSRQEIADSGLS